MVVSKENQKDTNPFCWGPNPKNRRATQNYIIFRIATLGLLHCRCIGCGIYSSKCLSEPKTLPFAFLAFKERQKKNLHFSGPNPSKKTPRAAELGGEISLAPPAPLAIFGPPWPRLRISKHGTWAARRMRTESMFRHHKMVSMIEKPARFASIYVADLSETRVSFRGAKWSSSIHSMGATYPFQLAFSGTKRLSDMNVSHNPNRFDSENQHELVETVVQTCNKERWPETGLWLGRPTGVSTTVQSD